MADCSKEYADRRFAELERLVSAWRGADQETLRVAQHDLERRLKSMNEFREQVRSERTEFMPRALAEERAAQWDTRIRALEATVARAQGAVALATLIPSILAAVAIVLTFVK